MLRVLIPCALAALIAAGASRAENVAISDPARTVIEHQLDAFQHDDAQEAYSYASPEIQALFTDPGEFLAMVVAHYPVVYRHRNVEFGESAERDGHAAESVLLTDDDGKIWQAIYKLEKEPDGRWLITGCVVAESEDRGA